MAQGDYDCPSERQAFFPKVSEQILTEGCCRDQSGETYSPCYPHPVTFVFPTSQGERDDAGRENQAEERAMEKFITQ